MLSEDENVLFCGIHPSCKSSEGEHISKRSQILKQLLCNLPADGSTFFLKAFQKERYLDLKLCAVRGYAAYASEEEVSILMNKLLALLKKRYEKTPYNYSEYEPMRSVFLMPYLLEHYNYPCFQAFNVQLEKQYENMPDCFKNIFTLDGNGKMHTIRDPKEVQQSMEAFWES